MFSVARRTNGRLACFQNSIIAWGQHNCRSFPWRETNDPYAILMAELMLQRTRADQVAGVYEVFMKKFPTIHCLSAARSASVDLITRPLGLNWRNQTIISAARFIVSNFDGRVPDSRDELLRIPGVGEYIAGMVLLTAYGKREWAVDSNIARVINRFLGLGYTGELRRKKAIIEAARLFFDTANTRPAAYAILDFSALICRARKPICCDCPVKTQCSACSSWS